MAEKTTVGMAVFIADITSMCGFVSDGVAALLSECSFVHCCSHQFVFSCLEVLFWSTPQTRHNFFGGIRIFSVKICINPYPSSMHQCIATLFTRFVSRRSLQKKIRHCVDASNPNRQIEVYSVLPN